MSTKNINNNEHKKLEQTEEEKTNFESFKKSSYEWICLV